MRLSINGNNAKKKTEIRFTFVTNTMMEVSKETETTTSTTCEEKRDEVEHKDAWKPIENVVEDKIEETVPVDVEVSAVQCSAVQCSAVQCSAMQCSAVQCSTVQ